MPRDEVETPKVEATPELTPTAEPDFLGEISELEDGFDVDLMACGCRVCAPETRLEASVADVIKLYDLNQDSLGDLLGMVIDHVEMDSEKLFELAEKVASGKSVYPRKSA